jgi:hypothetical protein
MREDVAADEEHLGQVAQAQLIAQPPQHHQQDDVGGKLQILRRTKSAKGKTLAVERSLK